MSPSKPAQHSESNADNADPTWDTSSLVLPKYHVDMCEAIDDDPEYTSLIQYGYVTIKGIHYFVSINHIDRYVRDLIPTGNASSPTIITDTDFIAIPVSAPVNARCVATDPTNAIEMPDGSKVHKRYTVNPEVVHDLDTKLATRVKNSILDKSTQNRLKRDTNNSGRGMLTEIKKKRDKVDS